MRFQTDKAYLLYSYCVHLNLQLFHIHFCILSKFYLQCAKFISRRRYEKGPCIYRLKPKQKQNSQIVLSLRHFSSTKYIQTRRRASNQKSTRLRNERLSDQRPMPLRELSSLYSGVMQVRRAQSRCSGPGLLGCSAQVCREGSHTGGARIFLPSDEEYPITK